MGRPVRRCAHCVYCTDCAPCQRGCENNFTKPGEALPDKVREAPEARWGMRLECGWCFPGCGRLPDFWKTGMARAPTWIVPAPEGHPPTRGVKFNSTKKKWKYKSNHPWVTLSPTWSGLWGRWVRYGLSQRGNEAIGHNTTTSHHYWPVLRTKRVELAKEKPHLVGGVILWVKTRQRPGRLVIVRAIWLV